MTTTENQIELELIAKLGDLKYTYASSTTYPHPPLDNFCTSHLTRCGRNLDKPATSRGQSKVFPGSLPLFARAPQCYRFRSPLIR